MQGGGERGLLSETCLRKEKKNQQNMLFRISVKEKTHLVILNGLICCLKENTKKKKYFIE